jgi:TctA family transporter
MTETQNGGRGAAEHVLHVVSLALMATGILYGFVVFAVTASVGSLLLPVFATVFGAAIFVVNRVSRTR